MPADISLKTAWEQGIAVEAPEADSTAARLYPPYDALLVVKHTTLTTVLHNDGRLNTPGLIVCSTCSDLVDPIKIVNVLNLLIILLLVMIYPNIRLSVERPSKIRALHLARPSGKVQNLLGLSVIGSQGN